METEAPPLRREEVRKVMTFCLFLGEAMLESSVATSDVEDSMRRMANALRIGRCEVSVTLNVINLCYLDPHGDPITMTRVVEESTPKLDRLVALDKMTRMVEEGALDIHGAVVELDRIYNEVNGHPRVMTAIAALVSAGAWVVFAGGGYVGAAAGMLAALVIEFVVMPIARSRVPSVLALALAAAVVVAVPTLFVWLDTGIAMTAAIVGGLYPLLPGGALVASVTDGLSGAPLSSMAKGLRAAMDAAAIALGVLGALAVGQYLEITPEVLFLEVSDTVGVVAAGVAVGAFGVARSLPWRLVPLASLLGMGSYLIAQHPWFVNEIGAVNTLIAAIAMGLGAQLAARLQRTTATAYTAACVYVLVPGVTLYISMLGFAQNDPDLGMQQLVTAVWIAGAIAAGLVIGGAIGRTRPKRHRADDFDRHVGRLIRRPARMVNRPSRWSGDSAPKP